MTSRIWVTVISSGKYDGMRWDRMGWDGRRKEEHSVMIRRDEGRNKGKRRSDGVRREENIEVSE